MRNNEDGSTNLEEVKEAFAPENHELMLTSEHKKLNHSLIKDNYIIERRYKIR